MAALSLSQQKWLRAIAVLRRPTMQELAVYRGMVSRGGAAEAVARLRKRGLVTKKDRGVRTVTITTKGRAALGIERVELVLPSTCPGCGRAFFGYACCEVPDVPE